MRKLLVGGALSVVGVLGVAGPAMAHECFNPNKPVGTGNSSIGTVTVTETGETVDITREHGAFITIDATALGAGTYDVHTAGNNPRGIVGPGEHQPKLACDQKGIDYLEACFGP